MSDDTIIEKALDQVRRVLAGELRAPVVKGLFHEPTFTASYVVSDPVTRRAAIVDSVWDFDQPSGRTSFESADEIVDYVQGEGLTVDWILETHAHADHLSAAPYLQAQLGGKLVIGARDRHRAATCSARSSTKAAEFRARRVAVRSADGVTARNVHARRTSRLIALHVPGHTPGCPGLRGRRCGVRRRYPVHA
jgi:glyoxylase-like metal-dependent hydrolase (beta-lactamase superfamily II)